MRQLAKESGLGLGTYYNYFSSKDEIVFAIFDSLFKEVFADEELNIHDGSDLKEDMKALNQKIVDKLNTKKNILMHFVQLASNPMQISNLGESIGKTVITSAMQIYWSKLEIIFKKHNMKLSCDQIEVLPQVFWHSLTSNLYMQTLKNDKDDVDLRKYLEVSLDLFCAGLKESVMPSEHD